MRDQADRCGLYEILLQRGICSAVIPYSNRFDTLSVDELNLTVRSSNGLKRAGAATFMEIKCLLERENGILSVRNLGQKSAKEIQRQFLEECYARLHPYERAQYWQEILDQAGRNVEIGCDKMVVTV